MAVSITLEFLEPSSVSGEQQRQQGLHQSTRNHAPETPRTPNVPHSHCSALTYPTVQTFTCRHLHVSKFSFLSPQVFERRWVGFLLSFWVPEADDGVEKRNKRTLLCVVMHKNSFSVSASPSLGSCLHFRQQQKYNNNETKSHLVSVNEREVLLSLSPQHLCSHDSVMDALGCSWCVQKGMQAVGRVPSLLGSPGV